MTKYIIPLFLISFCIFALIIWAVVYTVVKHKEKSLNEMPNLKRLNILKNGLVFHGLKKIK